MSTFIPGTPVTGHNFPSLAKGDHVVVVGAGAFGGWTSLYLRRRGCKVTLIDAWGPGHARGTSGDETRVIRTAYGSNEFYFNMAFKAIQLWKEYEKLWNRKLFYTNGVLWFCYENHVPLVDDSQRLATAMGRPYEYLSISELKKRVPVADVSGLTHAWLDRDGGYLKARESCRLVAEMFVRDGGEYIQSRALPGDIRYGAMESLQLSDGSVLNADAYVFACGAWLPKVFPEILGQKITVTKQEVFYLSPPAGDAASYEEIPAWIDADGTDYYYGIPGNMHRGFKVGLDRRGPVFDPETGDRFPSTEIFSGIRKFLAKRFPSLQHAPLTESRVCAYESTADGNFIFEPHPEARNVVLLGGGSGHGFKHGPALGEWVTQTLLH